MTDPVAIPQYFHCIVVPVARPDTAGYMLALAQQLIEPEEGRLIALIVSEGDNGEETSKRIEALKPVLDRYPEVELITQVSSSITRGILDGAREQGADALIMGVEHYHEHEVKLGTLVENVIAVAPCNVLVYRPSLSPDYHHIVVPLDNNHSTYGALETGVLLATKLNLPLTPYYIQRDYTPSREKQQRIFDILALLPKELAEKAEWLSGRKPAEKILQNIDEDDLLLLGFSQKADLNLEFGRNISQTLLANAPGPVLLFSRILEEPNTITGRIQRQLQRWNSTLTQIERNELIWGARKSALGTMDYSLLILMAAGLATLGLLLNSVAVIIGAMLVAPLMSPLGALALGLAVGEIDITRRATITLIQGVILALFIAISLGYLLPIENPTAEMLSRGNPSVLDAAVALVSGFVAAYALARKEIPAALAGVAIAAALMPPVCTIGLGIAMGNWSLAGGATLLFLANITSIVVAENLIFLWLGLRPGHNRETQRSVAVWWVLIAGMLAIVIALIFRLSQDARQANIAENFILEQLPSATLMEMTTRELNNGITEMTFLLRTDEAISPERVGELQASLAEYLNQPILLDIIALQTVRVRPALEQHAQRVLMAQFPEAEISNLRIISERNQVRVVVTLVSATTITIDDYETTEHLLSEAFGMTAHLEMTVEAISMPEATAEANSP